MANNSTKKRIDEPVCPSPLHYAWGQNSQAQDFLTVKIAFLFLLRFTLCPVAGCCSGSHAVVLGESWVPASRDENKSGNTQPRIPAQPWRLMIWADAKFIIIFNKKKS